MRIPAEVVQRFAYKNSVSLDTSNAIFDELERFLDVAATEPSNPPQNVDAAWHEFILHTRYYEEFCRKRYGRFIHHDPMSFSSAADCVSGPECGSSCTSPG